MQEGDYPVYDIQISLIDINAMQHAAADAARRSTQLRLDAFTRTLSFGNMSPRTAAPYLGSWIWRLDPPLQLVAFRIHLVARNGISNQQVSGRKVAGRWIWALRVTRVDEAVALKTTKEQVDAAFPRDAAAEPMWSDPSLPQNPNP